MKNKRIISLCVILCLFALLMSGCSTASDETASTATETESETESRETQPDTPVESEIEKESASEAEPQKTGYTIDNEVILDNDDCKFQIVKAETDDIWGFTLKAYCENKTSDSTMTFSLHDVIINGYMADPFWAEEVAAGKKSNSDIIMCGNLEDVCGYGTAEEITFTLVVYDSDDWDKEFVREEFTVYPTGLSPEEITYPERATAENEDIVVDNDDLTFVILGSEIDDIWGYKLNCFIANKTDKNVTMSLDDVSVNSYMVDHYWSASLTPGRMIYSQITFSSSALEKNGITQVEEIEFTARLYDSNDFFGGNIWEGTQTYYPA